MSDSSALHPGLTHVQTIAVDERLLVPAMAGFYTSFGTMPQVFATAYLVGFIEWACIELMAPHLDEGEGSLGVHVDFSHAAATPPGLTITVTATCTKVDKRTLEFEVSGHDGVDTIGGGRHRRAVVRWDKFSERVAEKRRKALGQS